MIQTTVTSSSSPPTRSRGGRRRFDADRYGPWAVVTGASSGIGRGFAERLAAEGVNLVLAARRTPLLDELGARLTAGHGTVNRVVTVDLAEVGGPEALIAATADLDVGLLVSNAGTGIPPSRFLDNDLAHMEHLLGLNVRSHLVLAHHFGGRLAARGRGGLILVSAAGALHGLPWMVDSSAAKSYVLNLGEGLHHELGPAGVDVTVLLPGSVETPIIDLFGIDRESMPVRPQSVASCVDETLRALRHHRATLVSGRLMRTAARLTPRPLSIRVNARMLGRAASSGTPPRSGPHDATIPTTTGGIDPPPGQAVFRIEPTD